ncbi:MAG: chromosomal replication initiator DnaA, partial [Desulfovibrio sp.]|nr:chromosomal replication initiator DnaA [Desulfovibrio sp.]
LLYLAQRCAQFRLLKGLLRKVEAFAALNGRPPLQADLENIVRTGGSARPAGCREILGSVARGFNLRPEDIMGTRRRPDLVLARQVAMYLCRRKLGLSYPELGRAFGGRDHSTVIHAVKKIRKLLDTDKVVHNLVTELENAVP